MIWMSPKCEHTSRTIRWPVNIIMLYDRSHEFCHSLECAFCFYFLLVCPEFPLNVIAIIHIMFPTKTTSRIYWADGSNHFYKIFRVGNCCLWKVIHHLCSHFYVSATLVFCGSILCMVSIGQVWRGTLMMVVPFLSIIRCAEVIW